MSDSASRYRPLALVAAAVACLAATAPGGRVPVASALPVPSRADDVAFGAPDAPLLVVEYASLTCGHCAAFEAREFPSVLAGPVARGEVRWVRRDYVRGDPFAVAEAMLARCVTAPAREGVADALWEALPSLRASATPADGALAVVARFGLGREQARRCVSDRDGFARLSDGVRAARSAGVDVTPTFVVGGIRVRGSRPAAFFSGLRAAGGAT